MSVLSLLLASAAAALTTAAVGAVTTTADGASTNRLLLVVFAALLVAAGYLRLSLRLGRQVIDFDLFEAVLAPVIFLVSPVATVVLVVVAKGASEAAQRVQPTKAAFNVASWAAAAAAGSAVFALSAGGPPGDAADLLPLALAVITVSLVNDVALVAVLRLAERRPLRAILSDLAPLMRNGWVIGGALNLACGMVSAAACALAPALAPLLFVPIVLLHVATQSQADARVQQLRRQGMQRATSALGSTVDPRAALPAFLVEVRTCFDTAAIEMLVEVGGRSTALRLGPGSPPPVEIPPEAVGFCRQVMAHGQSLRVAATSHHPLAGALAEAGWRDALAAPFVMGDGIAGALCCYDRSGLAGFERGELAVVDALARELGNAMHKAELLDVVLEERQKLAEIVNYTSEGIATVDPHGTVLSWNPGMERLTGWTSSELAGRPMAAALDPRDDEGRSVALDRWFDPACPLPGEVDVRAPEGERRWLAVSSTRVGDSDGGPRLLILLARDARAARELRRAERALRDSEARFRALVQNSSDMVSVIHPSGVFSYASPAAAHFFGTTESALVGRHVAEVVHPDEAEALQAELQRLATRHPDQSTTIEARLRHADGSWHIVEIRAANLLDEPSVAGLVLNSRDITARTRSEALLAGQAAVLDMIVQDAPLEGVLTRLAGVVEAQVGGSGCSIALLDERAREHGHSTSAHPEGGPPPASGGPAGGGPKATNGRGFDGRGGSQWLRPVRAADDRRVLGTVTVRLDEARRPDEADERLLELVTRLASIAIERVRSQAKLAHQATHDALTELPNRLVFLERVADALARRATTKRSVGVLFIDLDRFKVINDSLGHDAGDRLLTAVAQRLSVVVRPTDTLARFGGDEFTILCGNIAGEADMLAVAQRVRAALAEPFALDGSEVFATASIGIAVADQPDMVPEDLLENADAAMYRAKDHGGDHYEMFDQVMRKRARLKLTTQNALYRALERDEFRVFYQPTFSVRTGLVTGAEALLRWEHPARGLITPDQFIGLAEETGLIIPIGAHVLGEALEEAQRWPAIDPKRPLTISVNLSARQFAHPGLVSSVGDALRRTGIDPARVCLEITESVLMDDAQHTTVALSELKALGLCLQMDDFGTGYSSLSYLKRFPVDGLKVDRSFVDGIGADTEDTAIVTAVVALAHSLGLVAVAEGVETPEQLAGLAALGCDVVQGYLLGRPRPPEDFVVDLVAPLA